MLNLSVILEASARRYPGKTAVVFDEVRLSYAQLNAAANQVANGLAKRGIGMGDKVALSCPNLPYFPIVYYGILKTGATVVPLNVLLKRREIAYHLDDCDAKAYFCFQGTPQLPMGEEGNAGFSQVDKCEHFFMITADPAAPSPIEGTTTLGMLMHNQPPTFDTVQTSTEDTAVILYTSGTTGKPKGAELTHFNMFFNAVISTQLVDLGKDEISLIVLPLFHSFGQTVQMNATVYGSGTMVLLPRFDPDAVLAAMEKENVTIFCGVPTMYWALLNHPGANKYDLDKIARNLRVCGSGGAALPVEVLKDFEKRFNVPILEGYGLSETSPVASFNHLDRPRKPGSIGTPVWGVEMKVVDENDNELPPGEPGEVVIRGHNVMKGYYNRPEVNKEVMRGGWFHTGDVAKTDEDGYFYIVDRLKDMIIRGGFNVYPREIEEVLMTHPAISLAAVIGVPDEEYGEEIKAFVVLKAGASATPEEIVAWSKQNMAAYKYPRLVEIRDTLPMNATGKILKTQLRAES
ncbi:MAG: long-chain fatty acid--CoA ligase [Caldilineae bacterium]|nr:MAG: long-chain fatty acid--CoA ligase [Caldilineae bacterium]